MNRSALCGSQIPSFFPYATPSVKSVVFWYRQLIVWLLFEANGCGQTCEHKIHREDVSTICAVLRFIQQYMKPPLCPPKCHIQHAMRRWGALLLTVGSARRSDTRLVVLHPRDEVPNERYTPGNKRYKMRARRSHSGHASGMAYGGNSTAMQFPPNVQRRTLSIYIAGATVNGVGRR